MKLRTYISISSSSSESPSEVWREISGKNAAGSEPSSLVDADFLDEDEVVAAEGESAAARGEEDCEKKLINDQKKQSFQFK